MSKSKLDYSNKIILAPMVRVGTLPARLLALDFGADLVYCEEIIDFKMLECKRVVNALLGTIDYVMSDDTIVFRTCAREKDKVIFQVGTADAKRALRVAKMIENDVAAIDVNMGCPKEFSVKGGMGSALLKQPEKVKEILTTLVNGVKIPVTCKIRILPTLEETIAFAQMAESCGIAAIGIHGRRKEERPRHDNHNDIIKAVTKHLHIPVIANGGSMEIKCYEDIGKFRQATGASSVMIARAAQWNSSIFSKDGLRPIYDIIKAYLKYAIDYDARWENSKYCVQHYLHTNLETEDGWALKSSQNELQLYKIWQMESYHQEVVRSREEKCAQMGTNPGTKRRKLDNGKIIIEKSVVFSRRDYKDLLSPKLVLHNYLKEQKEPVVPIYHTTLDDKIFHSMVEVADVCYSPRCGDKSKKWAEQAAALVCLQELEIPHGHDEGEDSDWLRRKNIKPLAGPKNHSVNGKESCAGDDNQSQVK